MMDGFNSLDRLALLRAEEEARIDAVRALGAVPDAVGPDIGAAPARGAVFVFDFLASYPDGERGTVLKAAGFAGRRSMRVCDAFDKMIGASARRGRTIELTDAQIMMGRFYAALVERHLAGAVRCSSVEGRVSGGSGDADGFTQRRIDAARRIDLLRRRIGSGQSMALRRVRPSKRGAAARSAISDRALVDAVCLEGLTISEVLRRFGWSVSGDMVKRATRALGEALDRMIGPRPAQGIETVFYGVQAKGG